MKKLTTIIAVVLLLAMVVTITACTGPATQPSSPGPGPSATIPSGDHSITLWKEICQGCFT